MKTYLYIAIFLFAITKTYAQEPVDALRYSWITQSGTARNQAIGGASGSLGGEFSTLFGNPAGLGFYKTDELVITPGYNLYHNKNTYKGTLSKSDLNKFNLNASGVLFAFDNYPTNRVRNFTVALGVNRAADFNNTIYYKGTNNKTSYSEKYLEELIHNNVQDPNRAATDYPYGSSLAFNTYLIDTIRASNGAVAGYRSLAPVNTGLIQENTINSTGGITDLALGGAVNLKDKLFFGGTLTVPILRYERNASFKESDATGTKNNFSYATVNDNLETKGYGINARIGVIYKPVEYVRLGLAFHAPTFYELTDKYSTEVITDLEGYGGAGIKRQTTSDITGSQPGKFKYNLSTPWKIMASGSYVFREVENVKRQRAFITADIEYINYKAASFSAYDQQDTNSSEYFREVNKVIDEQYKGAFNFRLGGELKFNTVMVRLGGAYYGNPYKNEKASKVKLSGGLGYRNKGFFADLTYVYAMNSDVNYPYRLQDKPNDPATIKNNAGNIVATIGFKL